MIVYHITLIHMVIHAAQPLCRLAENFRDNARDNAGGGVCVGGGDRGHTEVAVEGTDGATGGGGNGGRVRQCECDIEFAPWRRACYRQCPTAGPEAICSLCDEIYESFQRSRGGQLSVREIEREREKAPAGRARTAERALGVRSYEHRRREHVSTLVLCQSEGHPGGELSVDFFRGKFSTFRMFSTSEIQMSKLI